MEIVKILGVINRERIVPLETIMTIIHFFGINKNNAIRNFKLHYKKPF